MSAAIQQGKVDLAELVARIRHEFPDLRFAKAALDDTGEDHAVVLLDDHWVFRFPRTTEAAARGASERRLLTVMNAVSSVATPQYNHVSGAGDFGGYRMIAGRQLTVAVFAALSRGSQERVLSEIGIFLRMLHALPAEVVTHTADGAITEDAAWFVDRYAERRGMLADALGANLLAAADRFYQALPSAVATSRVTVTHRDFTEDHILLDQNEGRLAGVIDFTDAGLGDPAYDFTFLWAYASWAPEHAALSYSAGSDNSDMLSRSLWWFTRYRIDQVWWSVSGARGYDVPGIKLELAGLFDTLGV